MDYTRQAILERRINKNSEYSTEIQNIEKILVKEYNKLSPKDKEIRINIHKADLEHLQAIVKKYETFYSVMLLKRYIRLDGRKVTAEKAEKLSDAIEKAISNGTKIKLNDKYIQQLKKARKNLERYIDKEDKTLEIQQTELSGIFSLSKYKTQK